VFFKNIFVCSESISNFRCWYNNVCSTWFFSRKHKKCYSRI